MADIKMDSEMRKQLLNSGLFPLSVGATKPHTPEIYQDAGVPEEMRPTFFVRAMSAAEKDEYKAWQSASIAKVKAKMVEMSKEDLDTLVPGMAKTEDESDADFEARKISQTSMALAVRYYDNMPFDYLRRLACSCIMGWSNFLNAEGQSVQYKGNDKGIDPDMWGMIPDQAVDGIVGYINKISGLLPIERIGLSS